MANKPGAPARPQRPLNDQQLEFLRLKLLGHRSTDAYRLAYPGDYSQRSCQTKSSKLAGHPRIIEAMRDRGVIVRHAIQEVLNRYEVSAERLADGLARLAFTELRQVATVETVNVNGKPIQVIKVKDFTEVDGDAHQALVEVKRTPGGGVTVKLGDKLGAMNALARLKGYVEDKPMDNRTAFVFKVER